MTLVDNAAQLRRRLAGLTFAPPVTHVYDPTDYAWAPHRLYLERYGQGRRGASRGRTVLLGMNPGPWGMAQTGVPFGEIELVRDWLGIEAPVGRPDPEHPKRPIEGFACKRSEVSGRRLWGWARERFGTPEAFFERFFVHNYCPLVFMETGGRNRTPDKLPVAEREPLLELCDAALRRAVEILEPERVVGVGRFAEGRAKAALEGTGVPVATILHPSPASPAANRGWAEAAEPQLRAAGVEI